MRTPMNTGYVALMVNYLLTFIYKYIYSLHSTVNVLYLFNESS